MKSRTKHIGIAVLVGYVVGAATGAVWVGSGQAIFAALLLAPLGILMSVDDLIWGHTARIILLLAAGTFIALLIVARLAQRPSLYVVGSFVFTASLAFVGGYVAAAITSV